MKRAEKQSEHFLFFPNPLCPLLYKSHETARNQGIPDVFMIKNSMPDSPAEPKALLLLTVHQTFGILAVGIISTFPLPR